MVEPLALARVTELFFEINRLHISYLQADESPQKIEQRMKLEGYIRKYLCHVAHGRKFVLSETAEILRRSVELKGDFSCYRASTAWNAIARYAANLVAQPWRKEFTVIKTFSGFYMHDIEENLVGAELLLECMGYKQMDSMSLTLQQPLDLDAVMGVSRDAIVAFVECQIMKEIWEGVSSQFECSWLDILNFRESHICSPDSAIKSMIHRFHQSQYHQHPLLSGISYNSVPRFHHHPDGNCLYGQTSLPYYGYPPCSSFVMSSQPRYACLVSPQQAVGYPVAHIGYQAQAKSPSELFPPNGFVYPHTSQVISSHMHNGFSTSLSASTTGPQNHSCVVPTGQLIELESSTPANSQPNALRLHRPLQEDLKTPETRNGCAVISANKPNNGVTERQLSKKELPHSSHLVNKSPRPTTLEDLRPKRNGVHPGLIGPPSHDSSYAVIERKQPSKSSSRKGAAAASMQDGTGTWEGWDYVYRNLESQGYSKDVGERGDILHNTLCTRRGRGSTGSVESSQSYGNTNIRTSHVFDAEASSAIDKMSTIEHLSNTVEVMHLTDESKGSRGVDVVDSRGILPDNLLLATRGSPHKEKLLSKGYTSKTQHQRETDKLSLPALDTKGNRKTTESSQVEDKYSSFWECVFCTYHNELGRDVCDMCGKSRQPGNEDKPLVSGGRECPKCTLVNERGVSSCLACNESLINSPTYI